MSESQEIRIRRTGEPPLVFRGALLAEGSSRESRGDGENRWHEVRVYRTAAGKIVYQVEFSTRWQGERDTSDVHVADTLDAAVQYLRGYDPTGERGIGYPPGEQFASRQERMLAGLRRRWDAMLGELLDALGVEERVE